MTTQQNRQRKRRAKKKLERERAPPSPSAFAFTIADAQSMGMPGRTKIYELDKLLKAQGKTLLFRDQAGRTMVVGDTMRELLSANANVKEEEIA